MLAIDTNVLVRFMTGDHAEQSRRARALVETKDIFVPTTVLLETEWVLRGVYGFAPLEIVKALAAFAGLPRVCLEDPVLTAKALDWTLAGMDFADALHLAQANGCEAMMSFDKRLVKVAKRLGEVEVRAP